MEFVVGLLKLLSRMRQCQVLLSALRCLVALLNHFKQNLGCHH
jgi:hypothetical protein